MAIFHKKKNDAHAIESNLFESHVLNGYKHDVPT